MVICLLCAQPATLVLDLGMTPLANRLRRSADEPQEYYPLRLVRCTSCGHLQIDHYVAPEILYPPDYPYITANMEHMRRYAAEMQLRFNRPKWVVDIGGNDGAFATCFDRKTRTTTVDPVGGRGSGNIRALFTPRVAQEMVASAGMRANLITCNNCLAHNANIGPILDGVRTLLAPTGTFVAEVAYALPMLRGGLFDLIYHEHIHHWLLAPMVAHFKRHGLEVFDVEMLTTHGGSVRVFARHPGDRKASPRLRMAVEEEAAPFRGLAADMSCDTAPGFGVLGYPAKACTLLHVYNVGRDIERVFDDNPNKVGKVDHFGHTIESTKAIDSSYAGPLLVASWNYAAELTRRVRGQGYMGKFFVPHPLREIAPKMQVAS